MQTISKKLLKYLIKQWSKITTWFVFLFIADNNFVFNSHFSPFNYFISTKIISNYNLKTNTHLNNRLELFTKNRTVRCICL